ncbi:unnamed protein product [Didymodactylos carnosus]|uniref:Dipeptidylpeptidase IV N-terminal domain-containing protein n=1 Tax=Didymodactylos carnosus TaxID=1234261 RepID=A0A8S2SY93_9BILA|nr:unnamed protein product [Didymodactylos carnosus]CAF4255713.1 unnamed protein product [Didymodactylos carnosus]
MVRITKMCFKKLRGNECWQVYHLDLKNGKQSLLTDDVKSQNSSVIWNNEGTKIAYYSTKRNGKDYDIVIQTISTLESKIVLQTEGQWFPIKFSPDDKQLLIQQRITLESEQEIFILNLENQILKQINQNKNKKIAYNQTILFDKRNGKNGLFLITDEDNEFRKLKYYNLDNDTYTKDYTDDINWDVV